MPVRRYPRSMQTHNATMKRSLREHGVTMKRSLQEQGATMKRSLREHGAMFDASTTHQCRCTTTGKSGLTTSTSTQSPAPCFGTLPEKPLEIATTTLRDNPRIGIPEGAVVPPHPPLALRFARPNHREDHVIHPRFCATFGRCAPKPDPSPKRPNGGDTAKPPLPPCPHGQAP